MGKCGELLPKELSGGANWDCAVRRKCKLLVKSKQNLSQFVT